MLRFLFGGDRRPEAAEAKAATAARELRALRAKVSRLEIELVRRRADVIVGARDCLIPVPRPGTSAARLLSQNKALRRRASAAEDRAKAALRDLLRAAAGLERAGNAAAAAELRARAATLADQGPQDAASDARLYEAQLRPSWDAVRPLGVAASFLARLHALEPGLARSSSDLEVAETIKGVVEALLDDGPAAAAAVLTSSVEVSDDLCALGAEAAVFALAGELGEGWTEEVRHAWCVAIDDIARALGAHNVSDGLAITQEDSTT